MPLPATIFTPDFLTFEHIELKTLLNTLRDPLALQLFFLIVSQADFKTGELVTNYARLIELCSPPSREKGGRAKGPTLRQVRYAIETLCTYNLVKRDTAKNAAQGMLRLRVRKRQKAAAR